MRPFTAKCWSSEYRESAWVLTDDPDRPKIRLDVNILVKPEVHASVDSIDMGRVRISTIKANPGVLELLQQTVILESRSADLRVTRVESDLPFMTLHHEPGNAAKRIRLDVGLDQAKLPGRIDHAYAKAFAGNLEDYEPVAWQREHGAVGPGNSAAIAIVRIDVASACPSSSVNQQQEAG